MKINKDKFYVLTIFLITMGLYLSDYPWNNRLFDGYNNIVFCIWLFFFVGVTKIAFKSQNLIVGIFVLLNTVTECYFFYIFSSYDFILAKGPFDFSAYSYEAVQKVNNLEFLALSIMLLALVTCSKIFYTRSFDFVEIKKNIAIYVIKLKKISQSKILIMTIVLIVLEFLILILTFNVFKGHYGTNEVGAYISIPNFLRSLISLSSLALYALVKTKQNFEYTTRTILFRLFAITSIFVADLSFGSRGSSVGMFFVLLVFDLLTDKHFFSKYFNLIISLVIIFLLIFIWPLIRFHIPDNGLLVSLYNGISYFFESLPMLSSVQFYTIPMVPQTLFHFLYVVDLIEKGISLDFTTFINLIPQQLPSIVENFGFTRPLNDDYRLMEYFTNGGGFYIFANAYWNGGALIMSIFIFIIMYFLIKIEIFFKLHKKIYFIIYPVFVYLIPVNTFYGIQPFIRGLEYGLIAMFIVYIFQKIKFVRK